MDIATELAGADKAGKAKAADAQAAAAAAQQEAAVVTGPVVKVLPGGELQQQEDSAVGPVVKLGGWPGAGVRGAPLAAWVAPPDAAAAAAAGPAPDPPPSHPPPADGSRREMSAGDAEQQDGQEQRQGQQQEQEQGQGQEQEEGDEARPLTGTTLICGPWGTPLPAVACGVATAPGNALMPDTSTHAPHSPALQAPLAEVCWSSGSCSPGRALPRGLLPALPAGLAAAAAATAAAQQWQQWQLGALPQARAWAKGSSRARQRGAACRRARSSRVKAKGSLRGTLPPAAAPARTLSLRGARQRTLQQRTAAAASRALAAPTAPAAAPGPPRPAACLQAMAAALPAWLPLPRRCPPSERLRQRLHAGPPLNTGMARRQHLVFSLPGCKFFVFL